MHAYWYFSTKVQPLFSLWGSVRYCWICFILLIACIFVIFSVLWIWIRSDPKLLAGSGYGSGKNHSCSGQLRIQNEFELKLLLKTEKFDNFSTKCLIKNINSFLSKNSPKSLFIVIICNLTHFENTEVKFIYQKKFMQDTDPKPTERQDADPVPKKTIPDPNTDIFASFFF